MVRKGILLRHIVSPRGIEVDKAKVDLIVGLPPPTSVHQVRSFLGMQVFTIDLSKTLAKYPVLCVVYLLMGCLLSLMMQV